MRVKNSAKVKLIREIEKAEKAMNILKPDLMGASNRANVNTVFGVLHDLKQVRRPS